MSAFISGGIATFEQSKKLAEYENRKASISFNISAGDGEDDATATVENAMALASQIVLKALNGETGLRQTFEDKVVAGKIESPTKPRAKKNSVPVSEPLPVSTAGSQTAPATDPADMGGTSAPAAKTVAADPSDIGAGDPFSAAPAAITDTTVQENVNRKVGGSGNGVIPKIKELIASYGVPHVSQLPQSVRQEFLQKVAAL